MIDSVADIAEDLKETDSSRHLQDISAHLAAGKMQAGVVGLTNSGKSTTLNALMGKEFLTTSIQAQMAAEVWIIHDYEIPNGKLLGQLTKAQNCLELACGPENIYAFLKEWNDSIREGKVKCPYAKLLLHAPIHFLKCVVSIRLEICDTAGTNEVGCTVVTSKSQLALHNLCTFVIILHVQHYEGTDELEMLQKLREHHPDLQENQDRILILVNACDLVILDTNKASIKPEDIASGVQTRLKKVLGIHITEDSESKHSCVYTEELCWCHQQDYYRVYRGAETPAWQNPYTAGCTNKCCNLGSWEGDRCCDQSTTGKWSPWFEQVWDKADNSW